MILALLVFLVAVVVAGVLSARARRVTVHNPDGGSVSFPDAETASEFMRRTLTDAGLPRNDAEQAVAIATTESDAVPPPPTGPAQRRLRSIDE